ncbi:hypothetical protein Agabi119p4_2717 [Agaricus bisporus var. burnettii]|uniref:Uncharacterized protein n=1 Tax=Agaricus bisporus var. burnettii TaxID=192524 RepID=A0A8H7F9N4_AGABI|nr:hypothetical protein Agabi119p4_2717 [Agaricus bisporus var. burnettii]
MVSREPLLRVPASLECKKDIEIVVRDAEVDLACTKLVESGLVMVTGSPARDDYGRKDDLRYLEPPSSAAAAWNDFTRKVYIVIYRESSVRLDVVADVNKEPEVVEIHNERLRYWIPHMKALHQSFLHVFLTSTFVEQEARMEMLLAYLHRELKVLDVPDAMKPG